MSKISMSKIRMFSLGLLAAFVVGTAASPQAFAQTSRPEDNRQTLEQRAVTAAIWGMPIVSVYAMRQAYFRDAKANYNDIVIWSKPSDWKFQTATPTASPRYVYFNFNTKDGPVVVEIPPAVGAGLFGSLLDAWQVPVVDVALVCDTADNVIACRAIFSANASACNWPRGCRGRASPAQHGNGCGYSTGTLPVASCHLSQNAVTLSTSSMARHSPLSGQCRTP